jgi:uncharacterized protein YndB with AHSA1/START domain
MTQTVGGFSLTARRIIRATPERLFAAWTTPALLMAWWGPRGATCTAAEVDLRVGGACRLANRFPDGAVIWIACQFEVIEPPRRLVYSWRIEGRDGHPERVTVSFDPAGEATEVTVTHERIADAAIRERHAAGWEGCLDGLERLMARP